MDPLSVAASVAGVAATGVQLSQTIYDLISTFYEAEKEMSSIANDLSLLAMVLNELEGVLQRDSRVYQRRMLKVVNDILRNCEGVFQSISNYVNPQNTRSSKQFQRKVCWYFQRHRVRPLQAGLESMKSTLNVLLHVVHLARVTEAAETFIPNAGRVLTHADLQKERRILVGVVLDNRRSILTLKRIEEDRDRGQNLRNIKRESTGSDSDLAFDDSVLKNDLNFGPTKTNGSGGFGSFGGWRRGTSAKTGTNTSLFTKAAKDSATDTGNMKDQKDKMTVTWSDAENSSTVGEKQGVEAEGINTGGDDDWGGFTTTATRKKQMEKRAIFGDGVPSVGERTIALDTALGDTETTADDSWDAFASSKDKKGRKGKGGKKRRQKEMEDNNKRSRDASPAPNVPARPASHFEHGAEIYEVPEAGSSSRRPKSFNGRSEISRINGIDDLPRPSGSRTSSPPQSSASENYSIAPEIPITENLTPNYSGEDIPSPRQSAARAKGLVTSFNKSQGSTPGTEIVTPTAQWFLSVVPHESNGSALIVRPRSVEANHLRARAEETVKTLLLNWTNLDPDVGSGEENSGGWNAYNNSSSYSYGPARDDKAPNQPHRLPYMPQAYPTYAPQQWYPPPFIAPPPLPPPVASPPPSPPTPFISPTFLNEKQTDIEELARLKKLILDEKAEQDARATATVAAAPLTAPIPPIATDEYLENNMQSENAYMETVDSVQMPQEDNTLWVAEPPRQQPVIMRDWLGRKFIFPVDMCQSWEGLDSLIQEAFGHVLEYRSMVEKGSYSISHVTGEVILPSTWESFVQPGLEIDMEVYADRDESGVKAIVSGRRDEASQGTLIPPPPPPPPPHAPEVPTLGGPMVLRSSSDDDPAIEDVADNETDYPFPDGISYVEQSDPRYLSIENALLEQKKAKVVAEMKLERNRRFFQLKQQLAVQGAAIQARQDAADNAEQDAKLAWLEKQVQDQKEELDRLPSLLMTPPSSSAGDSLSKSISGPQRKPSFRARLMGRMPSRSIRSKGSIRSQQMITEE